MELNPANSNNNSALENQPETIKELANKHMNDRNHIVTDDEIRNATVELTDTDTTSTEDLINTRSETLIPPIAGEPGIDESNDDEAPAPPNPYNVLGS